MTNDNGQAAALILAAVSAIPIGFFGFDNQRAHLEQGKPFRQLEQYSDGSAKEIITHGHPSYSGRIVVNYHNFNAFKRYCEITQGRLTKDAASFRNR